MHGMRPSLNAVYFVNILSAHDDRGLRLLALSRHIPFTAKFLCRQSPAI